MTEDEYPTEFLEHLKAITNKRARIVVEHILKYGFVTTEQLEAQYGYKHPPRAARDVREQGIPLETFRTKNAEGRTIAAYRFGDLSKIRQDKLGGRKTFSTEFKNSLIALYGSHCAVCGGEYEGRYLQIDHRIPYEVAGDIGDMNRQAQDYMRLCASCNRAKSWSCEHCINEIELKSLEICQSCYWAHPESYTHIALREIRRLDITWAENETEQYEQLKALAEQANQSVVDFVKGLIRRYLEWD